MLATELVARKGSEKKRAELIGVIGKWRKRNKQ